MILALCLGCDHDDRDLVDVVILFYLLAECDSIHLGHHHVGNDKVGHLFEYHVVTLLAIIGREDCELILKLIFNIVLYLVVVLNNKYRFHRFVSASLLDCLFLFLCLLNLYLIVYEWMANDDGIVIIYLLIIVCEVS